MNKNADRRQRLIHSAIELYATGGIDSTSTNSIARAAKVAAGTLFNYFETKDELTRAAYIECKREMMRAMQAGLSAQMDSRSFLNHFWSQSLEWALEHPEKHDFMRQFLCLPALRSAELEAELEREMEVLYRVIDRAYSTGELIPLDRDYLHGVFGALFNATLDYLRHSGKGRAKKEHDRVVRMSFDLLWRAVATPQTEAR